MTSVARKPNTGIQACQGFTLLEAIVALTIIGITLVPVMSFIVQASRQLTAAAESNRRVVVRDSVLALSESLNPLLTPEGEIALSSDIMVRWESQTLVDPAQSQRLGGRLGGYKLGFYAVTFKLLENEKDWFAFTTRKVGYQPLALPLMGSPGQSP
jgi:prepilin-type N-terminal cleavage/methylation domain-containing protein